MSTMPDTALLRTRLLRRHSGFTLDVDLVLPGRGVTALFGHSGSGKTTCLRIIAGLERAPGCHIEVNGEVWQDDARGLFVPMHRRAIGYVFQDAALFPHLNVAQNLAYGKTRRPAARPVDDRALITLLGIDHLLNRQPASLSGGERQRVAIARALLAGPRLLLMDEPLAALDLARKREILPYLERLHTTLEIPVLYVSHSPDEVVRLADHLVILDGGRVVAEGPLTTTLTRLDLPTTFADVGMVIEGVVAACDADYRMITLDFPGGSLRLVHDALRVGSKLRVQIKSRDVSLSLHAAGDTSILNVLPAIITGETMQGDGGHVLVGLDIGGVPLNARITRMSRDQLGLKIGHRVHAQIKAVSVLT
ncbi:MAG: molybdenum ABC transporter ATP-binding protein [Opitutaceae bacterium]|jgi:molybdate transport system ATP-binding protein